MCPVFFKKSLQGSRKGVAYCIKQSGYKITDADRSFQEMTGFKTGDSIEIDPVQRKYYSKKQNRCYDIELIEMGEETCMLLLSEIEGSGDHDGQMYRFIGENIHDIIYGMNARGVFDHVSSSWKTMLGYEPTSVEGTSFDAYVHPDDIDICNGYLLNVMEKNPRQSGVEYRIRHVDGSWRWHTSRAIAVLDENGEAAGLIGVASDMTDKIIISQSEQRYRTIINVSNTGAWEYDIKNDTQWSSPEFYEMLGYEAKDSKSSLEKAWIELMHPDDRAYAQKSFQEYIESKDSGIYESYFRLKREDGSYAWIWARGRRLSRDIEMVVGVHIDITGIREKDLRLDLAMSVTGSGIWDWDLQSSKIVYTAAWKNMLGYKEGEIEDTIEQWEMLCHPDDRDKLLRFFQRRDEYDTSDHELIYRMQHKNGDHRWIMTRGRLICDPMGKPVEWIGTNTDITSMIEAEEQINRQNSLINSLLDSIPDLVFYKDMNGTYLGCNPSFAERIGIKREEVIGKTDHELYPVDEADDFRDKDIDVLMSRQTKHHEEWISYPDGTRMLSDTVRTPYIGADGQLIGILGICRDMTERKRMEKEIYIEKEQFKTTLLSIGDAVISTDTNGRVNIMNEVAEELTGWENWDAAGRSLSEVFAIEDETTGDRSDDPVKKALETGGVVSLANHTILISKQGKRISIEDSAAPIKDTEGNVTGVVLIFRDFTEKKEKQERIAFLSFYDQLTSLYNRRFFEEELKRLDTSRNMPLTLVMLDVNGLKLINDAFGHLVGDKVLIKVAQVLRRECRSDDIIARIGGDEFVMLLPKTDQEQAELMLERIQDAVATENIDTMRLSVSFGWETKSDNERNIAEVLKRAEDNMYRKKLTESRSMHQNTVTAIMKTLFQKNIREEEHARRINSICSLLGALMGLGGENLNELCTTALMHDIGKIAVNGSILDKKGFLSKSEWIEIRRHPEIGYNILRSVNEYAQLAEFVLSHHERWDGKGYPKGLKGEAIPLQSRIIALADAYDAMTSEGSYREIMSKEEAIEEIRRSAGTCFDPYMAGIFIKEILSREVDI